MNNYLKSELFVLPSSTIIQDNSDYVKLETIDRPDFVFGNHVLIRESNPSPSVITNVIEKNTGYKTQFFSNKPFASVYKNSYYETFFVLRRTKRDEIDFNVKEIELKNWFAVEEFYNNNFDNSSFFNWRVREYHKSLIENKCKWFVYDKENIKAAIGIFIAKDFARLQLPVTAIIDRNQGIMTSLIKSVISTLNLNCPIIALADQNTFVPKLYKKVGFIPPGILITV
jgi:hypothetical protein